ncbi:MAG: hypothetical protein HY096_14390 [Nitrospinae bacterium]|nr:hypothetical protein [Nitrospinota bacterium]
MTILIFFFGEPRFVKGIDPSKTDAKSFKIEDEKLSLNNRLQQKYLAKECTYWIKEKVNIKSIRQINLLHGKMYHIDNNGIEKAFEELCNIFNDDTKQWCDMKKYNEILEKAVKDITKTFKKRNINVLLTGRGGKLIPEIKQAKGVGDFELITWLVIKEDTLV